MAALVAISFLVSSLPFYPFLNSDIAIQVLQAGSFQFPDDLYFWGQDRLGSIVPLLAHLIYLVTPLDALWPTAIGKWLMLLAGFVLATYWIKSRV